MTLKELRDRLNDMIVKNDESGSSIRNLNQVIIELTRHNKAGTERRYFPIGFIPDWVGHVREEHMSEYREVYTIQAREEDEIERP